MSEETELEGWRRARRRLGSVEADERFRETVLAPYVELFRANRLAAVSSRRGRSLFRACLRRGMREDLLG